MQRRNIVIISQIPLWSMGKAVGGPAISQTIRALGQHYNVDLVTPRLGYVDQSLLPEGVTLHEFNHRLHGLWRQVPKLGWLTDTLGWFTFRWSAWPIVKRLCTTKKVDLVYGYEIYGVPVARKAADRFGMPMVARYQGTTMCFRRFEKLAGIRYYKHLAALRTPADLYVMTDDGSSGDEILAEFGHPTERLFFPMNGVDRSILDAKPTDVRAALGLDAATPLLLTASRLMNLKRVDRAISALGILARGDSPAHLAIVGVGPLETQLRAQVAAEGVEDRVHFIGAVSRDELAGYYRAATALLALGDYSNLGNPLIEAMLLGTPIITLAEGHTDHLVHHEVNGVFVYDTDPTVIAAEIAKRLADPSALAAIGRNAASWIAENLWTWEGRMAAEIARLDGLMDTLGEGARAGR